MSPIKPPTIVIPIVEPSKPRKVNSGPLTPKYGKRKQAKPLSLSEVQSIFVKTANQAEQQKAEYEQQKADLIARGELDRWGNPIGTEYYDPDDPTSVKRKRIITNERRSKHSLKIRVGNLFGDLIVRGRARKIKAARPNLAERWRCECLACNRTIVVPRYYLLRPTNPKTHCGCRIATTKSLNPREYRIWIMIHQRTMNPRHESYQHYKSRGITLYEPWQKHHDDGFDKFLEHVGKCPGNGYSLDRINNNKGYEPNNLRWATAKEQRANQGDAIAGYTDEEIAELGYTEEEFIEKIIAGEIGYNM